MKINLHNLATSIRTLLGNVQAHLTKPASDTELGHVKVGENLTIDSEGKLNARDDYFATKDELENISLTPGPQGEPGPQGPPGGVTDTVSVLTVGSRKEGITVAANSFTSGVLNIASANASHAEGYTTAARGESSHAEGSYTTASGAASHAQGGDSIATGNYAFAGGVSTLADVYASTALGQYNKSMAGSASTYSSTSDAFVIGNGTSATSAGKANAFRVAFNGKAYGLSSYNSTGADYAEYFEWLDGNVENEDRVGYVVSLDGDKIRKATATDDYILGVISVNPSVIGDSWQDDWNSRYVTDEWGRIQYEWVDIPADNREVPTGEQDEEGNPLYETVEVFPARKEYIPKQNPDWNPDEEYVPREQRPEWTTVGLMGKLSVRDDGTCQVNGYAAVSTGEEGTLTASETPTQFRVMERVSDNIVRIFVK